MHEVIVDIDTDASVKVSVNGVAGKSCTEVTKEIENALGKTVKDQKTNDFYVQAKAGQSHR